VILTNLADI